MPTLISKPTYSEYKSILYRVCLKLQKHDFQNGFHPKNHETGNYMQSFNYLELNPWDNSIFSLTEIIDDALNCNLIREYEQEYLTAYQDQFKHGLRINDPY